MHKFRGQIIPICSFLLFASFCANAQEKTRPPALNNTIAVTAAGKFETAPDTALLQFNIAAQASASEAAYSSASKAAERMRQILKAQSIDPKSAELTQYSLEPMYNYRSAKRRVVGFRVTTNVNLKIKDFTKVGPLLTALSAIEQTEEQSINYTLENVDTAKSKAVEDGYKRAKELAETLAKASGKSLGEMSFGSIDTSESTSELMMYKGDLTRSPNKAKFAAPTEGFTPQRITINSQVVAVFALK